MQTLQIVSNDALCSSIRSVHKTVLNYWQSYEHYKQTPASEFSQGHSKHIFQIVVSRNGPRPREQYGYLSAGGILYNYDVIISDGNLVGTRCPRDSRGTSRGFAQWHVSAIQAVMCHLMGTICTRARSYSAIVHVYNLHCPVPKHEYCSCTISVQQYYGCTITVQQ